MIVANQLFLLACVAGCVGDTPIPSGGGGPDGRPPAPDAPAALDAGTADAGPFRCRDPITTGLDNGHHNAGQDCQNGCHNHGFYMSGTLYALATGGGPVAGASITFVDADGRTGDMHTGSNGNFWWSLPVAFPVTITASSCPSIHAMTAKVTSDSAGCNQSGCHVVGGEGRIHLP